MYQLMNCTEMYRQGFWIFVVLKAQTYSDQEIYSHTKTEISTDFKLLIILTQDFTGYYLSKYSKFYYIGFYVFAVFMISGNEPIIMFHRSAKYFF